MEPNPGHRGPLVYPGQQGNLDRCIILSSRVTSVSFNAVPQHTCVECNTRYCDGSAKHTIADANADTLYVYQSYIYDTEQVKWRCDPCIDRYNACYRFQTGWDWLTMHYLAQASSPAAMIPNELAQYIASFVFWPPMQRVTSESYKWSVVNSWPFGIRSPSQIPQNAPEAQSRQSPPLPE